MSCHPTKHEINNYITGLKNELADKFYCLERHQKEKIKDEIKKWETFNKQLKLKKP